MHLFSSSQGSPGDALSRTFLGESFVSIIHRTAISRIGQQTNAGGGGSPRIRIAGAYVTVSSQYCGSARGIFIRDHVVGIHRPGARSTPSIPGCAPGLSYPRARSSRRLSWKAETGSGCPGDRDGKQRLLLLQQPETESGRSVRRFNR